ncbi:MAG: OmpA family protein [Alphaproteobacteria bacterium]|nr:OmpA family protein [Alphaproteobacteria bacterium]
MRISKKVLAYSSVCLLMAACTHVPPPTVISSYEIYFDSGKDEISSTSQQTLKQIYHDIRTLTPTKVTVTGYTDTSGDAKANKTLSRERVDTVVSVLKDRGIHGEVMSEAARGETHLAVKTGDGVAKQANRRVVVDFYH